MSIPGHYWISHAAGTTISTAGTVRNFIGLHRLFIIILNIRHARLRLESNFNDYIKSNG
jgi:hypothetical protein